VPALHPPTKRQDAAVLANSSAKSMNGTLRIDHVYLIVLVGVSADQFE
jgi:hypothetical protein